MTVDSEPPLHCIEISKRPPRTWLQVLNGILYMIVFNFGNLMINFTQLMFLLPLKLVPHPYAKELYEEGIRYTMGAFGVHLTLACQLFAPTKLRITFETEGDGSFTKEQIEEILVRDKDGSVVGLHLPKRMVLIANHQIYADWLYIWCLLYFANLHRHVLIVVKRSLKWVPIVGWGMQIYRFIFLARSLVSDKGVLNRHLSKLGRQVQKDDNPLAFIIFPEGTLVSNDTRPISKKFADKTGIADMRHMLLPRSTGLMYALRSLSPKIPSLKLLDITMTFPGIPRSGYGQSYYTLRSIFLDRVPPPVVNMHLRMWDVADAVPIGDLSGASNQSTPSVKVNGDAKSGQANGHVNGYFNGPANGKTDNSPVEINIPEEEHKAFDAWLRRLWTDKDATYEEYLTNGAFKTDYPTNEIPLRLKSPLEALNAFCNFAPAIAFYAWGRFRSRT